MTTEPRASLVEVEQREQIDAWLTANCGKGLPYGEATDLPSALHGLAYILRQIEGTTSYKVHIGQCNSATSALRWVLDHFALEALRTQGDGEGESLRGALNKIAFLSTNHGGWFENDPFGAYGELGDIARAALAAPTQASSREEGE